jgi:hypothetical protein
LGVDRIGQDFRKVTPENCGAGSPAVLVSRRASWIRIQYAVGDTGGKQNLRMGIAAKWHKSANQESGEQSHLEHSQESCSAFAEEKA